MLKSTSECLRAEKSRADEPCLAATIGHQAVRAKGSRQIEEFRMPRCPRQSPQADGAALGQAVTNCSAWVRGERGVLNASEAVDISFGEPRTSLSHTSRPLRPDDAPSAHAVEPETEIV